MKRRNVLKSLAGVAGIAGVSRLASANDCNGVSDWDAGTTYTGGDQAVFDGSLWEAQWWSQGDEPGSSDWGPWEEVGDCDEDSDEDTDDGGDDDEDDGEPDDGDDESGDCTGVADWDADATYTGGDQVVYNDYLWEASWWSQGDEPGSSDWGPWVQIGPCDEEEDEGEEEEDEEDEGEEEEEPDTDISASTTLAEFFPEYDVDLAGPGGDTERVVGMLSEDLHPDASQFGADVGSPDGSMELGSLGSRGLELVKQLDDTGVPRQNNARIVAWLAGLAEETEEYPFDRRDDQDRDGGLTADKGPVSPGNNPSVLVQDEWPSGDGFDDVYVQSERSDWSSGVSESQYTNTDNPIIDATVDKVHPLSGENLGDGFSANAPVDLSVEIHGSGWSVDVCLVFENTTEVPLLIDGSILWWVGPAKELGSMSAFDFGNDQRDDPSVGHPQRDVIEVALPPEAKPEPFTGTDAPLSAWGMRPTHHNNNYMYRALYPNQQFSMTYENAVGDGQFGWDWDDVVDVIADTCHIEFRTEMDSVDRNTDLVETLDMKNRYGN